MLFRTLFFTRGQKMKRIIALCTTALFAIALLTGCDTETTKASSPALGDVNFTGIPASAYKSTARIGEQDIRVVSFRADWKDYGWDGRIHQLVFKTISTAKPEDLFQNPRLVGDGIDLSPRNYYSVQFDGQYIVVDFLAGWIPATYLYEQDDMFSLVMDMRLDIASDIPFQVELVDVQMHDYSKTWSGGATGALLTTSVGNGDALPLVSSFSPQFVEGLTPGVLVSVGTINISCPSGNKDYCVLNVAEFDVWNVDRMYLKIMGNYYELRENEDGRWVFSHNWGFSIGENFSLEVFIEPSYFYNMVSLKRMSFTLDGVFVGPIIPTNGEGCGTIVSDYRFCKG